MADAMPMATQRCSLLKWTPLCAMWLCLMLKIRSGPELIGKCIHPRSRLVHMNLSKPLLEVIEEIQVYFIDHLWLHTKFETLKHPDKLFSIHKLDGIDTVSYHLSLGLHCRASGSEQDSLIRFTNQCSAKESP